MIKKIAAVLGLALVTFGVVIGLTGSTVAASRPIPATSVPASVVHRSLSPATPVTVGMVVRHPRVASRTARYLAAVRKDTHGHTNGMTATMLVHDGRTACAQIHQGATVADTIDAEIDAVYSGHDRTDRTLATAIVAYAVRYLC